MPACSPNMRLSNPRCRTAAILKIEKNRYLIMARAWRGSSGKPQQVFGKKVHGKNGHGKKRPQLEKRSTKVGK